MYHALTKIITVHNETYNQRNDRLYLARSAEDQSAIEEAMLDLQKSIQEYANTLDKFITRYRDKITKADLQAFDLVPYRVWNEMSQKFA